LRSGGELVVIDVERDPGSSARASKALVRAEIEALGFHFVEEQPLLRSSYFLRFAKS
jgi:hypothetical protein